MKKNFIYALMSAIALTGAVGISSCSSSEDVVDVNPTYDGEAVKTQFTISLPFNKNTTTRQAYTIVQAAESSSRFRGMSNIVLIPFQSATDRTIRLGENITLGENKMIIPSVANDANSIPNGQLLAKSNAVLYNDVTIPVGTAGFLFYGVATASTGGGGTNFTDGLLTATGLTGETSGISFTPTPVLGWKTGEGVDPFTPNDPTMTKGNALATYVSSIAAASYDEDGTENDIQYIWAKCANSANSTEAWYNAGLGAMYDAFTSMKAGASSYVQAAVQDLYTSILNNTDKVSIAIKSAITNATYVSNAAADGTLTFTEAITGYPADNNMPEGAAALLWSTPEANNPKVATAVGDSNFGHLSGGMNVVNMKNIVYPASLYYFVDSPIKTSNTSRVNDYDGEKPWQATGENNDILDTYKDGTAVQPATRSVAIEKPIQYAVGRLDVKVNALSATTYYDRKGEEVSKTYVPDPAAPETTAPAFQLTGVLIGGQKAVDYKFEQSTSTTEYTIYDNVINTENSVSAVVPTSGSEFAGPTYTMALETASNTSIYVALEFVNNSNDFQGYDGVVKHGCKFYMIAQLNPENGNTNASNQSNTGNKVFKQDFKTIANFTFGAGTADTDGDGASDTPAGFANAYTTIPDLRTPQLELGLSVDLEWQEGITFNVTF